MPNITGHTELVGLMAYPIRHTQSPTTHNLAYDKNGDDVIQLAFEVDNDSLKDAVQSIRALKMLGSNISMPNKTVVHKYLDEVDEAAKLCGAINTVVNLRDENGQVTGKAYLAIKAGTMTEQMAAQYNIDITEGVFVYSTESGGAGEKAGLQLGDVITKLNDTAITSMNDLSAAKKSYKAGDTVTLTVYRNGEYITLDLTFDEQPQTTGEDTDTNSQQDNQQSGQDYSDMFRDFYDYYFGQNGR